MAETGVNIPRVPGWDPQPKQRIALTAPVDELFYGGGKGGGKSDFLLMDFVDGIQYGEHHKGILFRRSYSELEELLARSRQLYPLIGGDYSETKRTWTFPGGATLKMRFLERDKDVHRYQGHQYCVSVGTKIQMANGDAKPIEYISVGEYVATLEGPRQVIKTLKPYKSPCVKVSNHFGDQIQPVWHPILTASGWQSYASLRGICSTKFEDSLQGFQQLPSVNVSAICQEPPLGLNTPRRRLSILSRSLYKLSRRSLTTTAKMLQCAWGHLQLLVPFGLFSDHIFSPAFSGGRGHVLFDWGTAIDCLRGCLSCHCQCDGQPLDQSGTYLTYIPLQADAATPSREHYKLDDQDNIQECGLPDVAQYEHPYTGQVRVATEKTFCAPCVMSPLGDEFVCDITVDDVNHYISYDTHVVNKNTWIGFDELTNWATDYCYVYMFSCARSAFGIPVRIRASGNPGSVGHFWVKERFIDGKKPYKIYRDISGMSRCFIPALLEDNIRLQKNDPQYEARLKLLPKHLYEAYRHGDWNVFAGQAFHLSEEHHIIQPIPIPGNAPIYMTFDWGFGKPFSLGWWWIDADGRAYRFMEWYGYSGKANEGLRLSDSQIAEGIIEREIKAELNNRIITRILSPDCFSKKPDYKGGGQGKSTSEVFSDYRLYCTPGDATRHLKIRQFRERLRVKVPEDGKEPERPMMLVYNTCDQFIRTIPILQVDAKNQEDVDTDLEDHCYDEACLLCMARPLGTAVKKPLTMPNDAEAIVDAIETHVENSANIELLGIDDLEDDGGFYATL